MRYGRRNWDDELEGLGDASLDEVLGAATDELATAKRDLAADAVDPMGSLSRGDYQLLNALIVLDDGGPSLRHDSLLYLKALQSMGKRAWTKAGEAAQNALNAKAIVNEAKAKVATEAAAGARTEADRQRAEAEASRARAEANAALATADSARTKKRIAWGLGGLLTLWGGWKLFGPRRSR